MSARILILDTVATNRIMLKVKMMAAGFVVDACANILEAEQAVALQQPSLIVICISEHNSAERAFCAKLRNTPATSGVPVIIVGVADTSQARFAALDAGADDVMPHPVHDTLLLARIRSLLRTRSALQDLDLRKTTGRALGFDDAKMPFAGAAETYWVTAEASCNEAVLAHLSKAMGQSVKVVDFTTARTLSSVHTDLLVIDTTSIKKDTGQIIQLLSQLQFAGATRHIAQMILTPPEDCELAALCLDIGADDVIPASCGIDEIAHRIKATLKRRQRQTLRASA